MSNRQQFYEREESILCLAELMLVESDNGELTLDELAQEMMLAKGTLYKHFSSKDELYLKILIRHEKMLLAQNEIDDGSGAAVVRLVLQALLSPRRALLFALIEERLAASATGLQRGFAELYDIRRARMNCLLALMAKYLETLGSDMSAKDYLSSLWVLGQGGANLLVSSFYQRYLGRRDMLILMLVLQALDLPKLSALKDVQVAVAAPMIMHAVDVHADDEHVTPFAKLAPPAR